jgi:molecular chaperone IbpA
MTRLTTLDLPHFTRATVGFDRLFEELNREFANTKSTGYPPYNVAQINDDEWMISIAVAGFGMDNLDITLDKNTLTVEGIAPVGGEEVKYLHKGIAGRNFRRQFTLAEHIEVRQAGLELGMLNIHLVRNVPEELQPKKIAIVDTSNITIEG